MFNVISIKQAFAGHARQAGMLAASCQSGSHLGRFVVVVDDDIDPTNLFEVVWAMCTRCDPVEDIDFVRKAWSGPLDPRIPRGVTTNSRAVIVACRPFERLEQSSGNNGFGLGLAIARSAVTAHHGTIRAANRPGGGLVVTLRLPLAPGALPAPRSALDTASTSG